jgi:4-hydroxybenzoate polyprenyltransferase
MPTIRAYLQLARFDHWVKNVFVLPGVIVALGMTRHEINPWSWALLGRLIAGLLATGLIASSNYILNELMDAPFDRHHPIKGQRPVPSGRISLPIAYIQWLLFMLAGMGLALWINRPFAASLGALWIMGLIYNVPPVRSKDVPYVDVLSEAINNPLRMLAGWYIVNPPHQMAPGSLLMSYWMVGCYFMAVKRLAELRQIGDPVRGAAYRRSFTYYTEPRLLVAIVFYASAAMLFFGAFIMRYRLELIVSFPLVALVMAVYLALAFKPDSAAQSPEKLYKEPLLMGCVVGCAVLMTVMLAVDVPLLHRMFEPTAPTNPEPGRIVPARVSASLF